MADKLAFIVLSVLALTAAISGRSRISPRILKNLDQNEVQIGDCHMSSGDGSHPCSRALDGNSTTFVETSQTSSDYMEMTLDRLNQSDQLYNIMKLRIESPTDYQLKNIAMNKPTSQSSTRHLKDSGLAVDGVIEGPRQFSATRARSGEWWKVDLLENHYLIKFLLHLDDIPRSTYGPLTEFHILVTTDGEPDEPSPLSSIWQSVFYEEEGESHDISHNFVTEPVLARYLAIFTSHGNGITLREVELYGYTSYNLIKLGEVTRQIAYGSTNVSTLTDGYTGFEQFYIADGWLKVELNKYYCLSHIKVYNTPALENIALARGTSSSSTGYTGLVPGSAVNGIVFSPQTSPDIGLETFSTNETESTHWWEVRLWRMANVSSIKIYAGSYVEYFMDDWYVVGKDGRDSVSPDPLSDRWDVLYHSTEKITDNHFSFSLPTATRYTSIGIYSDNHALYFSEVEVYGFSNLFYNRPALSRSNSGVTAEDFLDTDMWNNEFRTSANENQWMFLTMQRTYYINKIGIYVHGNCLGINKELTIYGSTNHNNERPGPNAENWAAFHTVDSIDDNYYEILPPDGSEHIASPQHVGFHSTHANGLCFAYVDAYGYPLDELPDVKLLLSEESDTSLIPSEVDGLWHAVAESASNVLIGQINFNPHVGARKIGFLSESEVKTSISLREIEAYGYECENVAAGKIASQKSSINSPYNKLGSISGTYGQYDLNYDTQLFACTLRQPDQWIQVYTKFTKSRTALLISGEFYWTTATDQLSIDGLYGLSAHPRKVSKPSLNDSDWTVFCHFDHFTRDQSLMYTMFTTLSDPVTFRHLALYSTDPRGFSIAGVNFQWAEDLFSFEKEASQKSTADDEHKVGAIKDFYESTFQATLAGDNTDQWVFIWIPASKTTLAYSLIAGPVDMNDILVNLVPWKQPTNTANPHFLVKNFTGKFPDKAVWYNEKLYDQDIQTSRNIYYVGKGFKINCGYCPNGISFREFSLYTIPEIGLASHSTTETMAEPEGNNGDFAVDGNILSTFLSDYSPSPSLTIILKANRHIPFIIVNYADASHKNFSAVEWTRKESTELKLLNYIQHTIGNTVVYMVTKSVKTAYLRMRVYGNNVILKIKEMRIVGLGSIGSRLSGQSSICQQDADNALSHHPTPSTTQSTANQWWKVNLGRYYFLRYLEVQFNPESTLPDHIFLMISTTPTDTEPSLESEDWHVLTHKEMPNNFDVTMQFTPTKLAHHIAIYTNSTGGLSIRHVKAFGHTSTQQFYILSKSSNTSAPPSPRVQGWNELEYQEYPDENGIKEYQLRDVDSGSLAIYFNKTHSRINKLTAYGYAAKRCEHQSISSIESGSADYIQDHSWPLDAGTGEFFATEETPNQYIVTSMVGDWLIWRLLIHSREMLEKLDDIYLLCGPDPNQVVSLDSQYWHQFDYQDRHTTPYGYSKNFYPEFYCSNLAVYAERSGGIRLDEIVIYAEHAVVNLALGKETLQSSSSFNSSLAIDNDMQTFSQTQSIPNQWWRVDLAAAYRVGYISVRSKPSIGEFKRRNLIQNNFLAASSVEEGRTPEAAGNDNLKDIYRSLTKANQWLMADLRDHHFVSFVRIKNSLHDARYTRSLTVLVSNQTEPGQPNISSTDWSVAHHQAGGFHRVETDINVELVTMARFVALYCESRRGLTVAKIGVYGFEENLALLGSVKQSSGIDELGSLAIDGKLDNLFASTEPLSEQWMQLTLSEHYQISVVEIIVPSSNTTDELEGRDLVPLLYTGDGEPTDPRLNDDQWTAYNFTSSGSLDGLDYHILRIDGLLIVKYLAVFSTGSNGINITEWKVYGYHDFALRDIKLLTAGQEGAPNPDPTKDFAPWNVRKSQRSGDNLFEAFMFRPADYVSAVAVFSENPNGLRLYEVNVIGNEKDMKKVIAAPLQQEQEGDKPGTKRKVRPRAIKVSRRLLGSQEIVEMELSSDAAQAALPQLKGKPLVLVRWKS